jgi:hypothetical protein
MSGQNELLDSGVPIGRTNDEAVDKVLHNVVAKKLAPEDLETYKLVSDVEDRRVKMQSILGIWRRTQEDERKLRRTVAYWILGALFVELAAGNTAFFLIGFDRFTVSEWVAQTFIVGMYTQIVSIVLIVVKSLFPAPKTDILSELNQMVDKL